METKKYTIENDFNAKAMLALADKFNEIDNALYFAFKANRDCKITVDGREFVLSPCDNLDLSKGIAIRINMLREEARRLVARHNAYNYSTDERRKLDKILHDNPIIQYNFLPDIDKL